MGNYKKLLLKSPFEKGGFRGILRTSKLKEFMTNAIKATPTRDAP
jgi:hypothetical protein